MGQSIKTGDHGIITSAVLTNDGAPADISGATVRLILKRRGAPADDEPFLDVAASNDQDSDETMGHVSYTWQDGDTYRDDEGLYKLEWEVTYGGGAVQTFPSGGWNYLALVADQGGTGS